ncbi:MAG TPA: BREX system ATP-binding domain-containing protein [Micromonosporaceae bacterium]|nr:BREX system ATP-binding domain-containing protein [Micromonosporaceae bacterium]
MTGETLGAAEYLDFAEREYLESYVALGGSSVKLLSVADDSVVLELTGGLASVGGDFACVSVDAATTRVHLIDQVFTAIARQVDWVGLAEAVVRRVLDQAAFPVPAEHDGVDLAAVARHHEIDAAELYRTVRRAIEQTVLRDTALSHEFRVAMLRLCQERLGRGDVSATERETVIGWLCGDRLPAADLRRVSLHSRVARHNAWPLLASLGRWVRLAGRPGLVLGLDLNRLAVARRPPVGLRDGHYYSKAAILDAYEVLRQFIDATDELEGLFVAALLPSVLVHDDKRGLSTYTALQMRVADEVRDRRRANPYAALVRVGPQMGAAA